MFSNQAAVLSLNFPCRCLEAISADRLDSRFVAASSSLHEHNELVVLRFHSELNELGVDARLEHVDGPVGALSTSPFDKTLLITAVQDGPTIKLWRVPHEAVDRTDELEYSPDSDSRAVADAPFSSEDYSLEEVSVLSHDKDEMFKTEALVWRGSTVEEPSFQGDVVSADCKGKLTLWDIDTAQAVRSETMKRESQLIPSRVAWDPHNPSSLCATTGRHVALFDWRDDASEPTSLFKAHRFGVSDVDYNPNKPYALTTAGLDGLLKFWDLRNTKVPLLSARGGHGHYVWNVKYNPFHDQLLASTGTDSVVNLWRVSTISSAPLLTLDEEGNQEKSETSAPNVRVARYEHADSVYGMAWSAADSWIYASVGYDGKVALNHVSNKEKYKILL